jgi:hypothetical protein
MKNAKEKTKKESSWREEIRLTNHFIERYNTRVLSTDNTKCSRNDIYDDMDMRLTNREKLALDLFRKSNNVILPMRNYQLVMKNNVLITIY